MYYFRWTPFHYLHRIQITLYFLILTVTSGFCQHQNVSGSISDTRRQPIPYAHVYLTDSVSNIYIGTVSDLNGNFEIQIPIKYLNFDFSISCVGFELFTIPMKQALEMQHYMLKESERILSMVVFKDLSAKDLIRKGIEKLSDNYMNSKFINQYYSWKGLKMDSSVIDFQEQYLTLEESFSSQRGTRRVLSDSVYERFSYTETVDAEELYGLSENLYFDLIKSGATIFNKENFSDWEFTYLNHTDSIGSKDVVIRGSRLGRKGFNELTFYLDIEDFAFKRVDFLYEWGEQKNLNKKVNDSLYYHLNKIEGIFLYEKTAKNYNTKYQFLKVDYTFQYRSPVWNHGNRKFKGIYVEEMNVLCSTESKGINSSIPSCNLKPIVVNTRAYGILKLLP